MSSEWAVERAREIAGEFISVVNVVHQVTDAGSVLVFEWTAMTERYDEPWPVPAASLCRLGPNGELLSRRNFGLWLKPDE